jgi:carboxyl-terminal processing protease
VGRGTRHAAPVTVTLLLISAAALTAQLPQGLETFDAAWTTVRDKHFDEKLNGVDWEAVRRELRPRAEAATTTGELRAVIRDMLGRLGQSHFALIPATAEPAAGVAADLSGDPGFDVRLVGRDLLVTGVEPTGPAAAAGLKPGWRLTAIGTAQVADLLRTLSEGASERLLNVEAWRIAESRLRGPAGSTADVTFENGDGKPVTLAIQRRAETGRPVTVGNLPTMFVRVENERRQTPRGGTAGIIRFNVWMTAVDGPFQRAMDEYRSADGIIIDLRGNPGGLAAMMMGIAGHFMTDRQPLGVMKTRDNEPLRFVANPRLVSAAGLPVQPFAGPVAILVDAMSGSASECFTGGMQSLKRARVFGQTSMGQALPALFQRLPNGDLMIHAYGDFVTSDGTRLEGRGVVPDEILPLRREDLLAGRDRTLDAALAWIDQARAAGKPQHP